MMNLLAGVAGSSGLGGAMAKFGLLSKYGGLRSSEITSGVITEVAKAFGHAIDQVTCERVASVLKFDDANTLADFIQAPGNFEKVLQAVAKPPDSVNNSVDDDISTCSSCGDNFIRLPDTKSCPLCDYTPGGT